MLLLLDTNVTSELRRAKHTGCDPVFATWAASTSLSEAYISVITVHEMLRGVLLMRRKDPRTAAVYQAWLEELLLAFEGRILPVTLDAAALSARYHVPDPVPFADALIAGTAETNHLTIVTRNVSDFTRFKLPLINPWKVVN